MAGEAGEPLAGEARRTDAARAGEAGPDPAGEPARRREPEAAGEGHRPRVHTSDVLTVRIQVRQDHRHVNLSREPPPGTAGAGAKIHDATSLGAFDGAPKQRPHRIVRPGHVLGEGQKVGQRIAERRWTGREIVDFD